VSRSFARFELPFEARFTRITIGRTGPNPEVMIRADVQGASTVGQSGTVSPRPAYHRSVSSHDAKAANVLDLHTRTTAWIKSLPVPVESIVDDSYRLRVSWDDIPETPGEDLLALLQPKARTIVFNDRHQRALAERAGTYRFTLAHELGHWLYDAEDPAQSHLFDHPVFCRRLAAGHPDHIREVNANQLAAALLMPAPLVRAGISRRLSTTQFHELARGWGVARPMLRSRLEALELGWCLPDEEPTLDRDRSPGGEDGKPA
jgi:hypothetical protein